MQVWVTHFQVNVWLQSEHGALKQKEMSNSQTCLEYCNACAESPSNKELHGWSSRGNFHWSQPVLDDPWKTVNTFFCQNGNLRIKKSKQKRKQDKIVNFQAQTFGTYDFTIPAMTDFRICRITVSHIGKNFPCTKTRGMDLFTNRQMQYIYFRVYTQLWMHVPI